MGAFHPRADQLPDEFPIFPLAGALLLPSGKLPLNIFEPRYLALVEDSLGAGRMFGMIQPNPILSASPLGPALFSIGCLGRVSTFSETDDGRYLITLTGVIRFEVGQHLGVHRGYRRVRGRYHGFTADLEPPAAIGLDRARLLDAVRAYFGHCGFDANWDAIGRMPDAMLVTTLAMVCPFAPAEKQALLEAPTISDCAQVLYSLLQIGRFAATEHEAPPATSRC